MRFSVGDIVELRYPRWHHYVSLNGLRVRVTRLWGGGGFENFEGIVLASPENSKYKDTSYRVGKTIDQPICSFLVVINSPNSVYLDHIFNRLTDNATETELLNLAERLKSFAKYRESLWKGH